jgi:hypothetical protein
VNNEAKRTVPASAPATGWVTIISPIKTPKVR